MAAIKEAFKQLKVLQQLSLADLAARLEPSDPLVAEVAAAEAANAATAASGEAVRCVKAVSQLRCRNVELLVLCHSAGTSCLSLDVPHLPAGAHSTC